MTCANWMITIFAVAVFILVMWPSVIGAEASKWIIAMAAVLILIIAWTGCKCRYCEKVEHKKR